MKPITVSDYLLQQDHIIHLLTALENMEVKASYAIKIQPPEVRVHLFNEIPGAALDYRFLEARALFFTLQQDLPGYTVRMDAQMLSEYSCPEDYGLSEESCSDEDYMHIGCWKNDQKVMEIILGIDRMDLPFFQAWLRDNIIHANGQYSGLSSEWK